MPTPHAYHRPQHKRLTEKMCGCVLRDATLLLPTVDTGHAASVTKPAFELRMGIAWSCLKNSAVSPMHPQNLKLPQEARSNALLVATCLGAHASSESELMHPSKLAVLRPWVSTATCLEAINDKHLTIRFFLRNFLVKAVHLLSGALCSTEVPWQRNCF